MSDIYPIKFLHKPEKDFSEDFVVIENASTAEIEQTILGTLKSIYDPELPVSIYDLGLIYKVVISKDNQVETTMTLTTPNCPVAESLPLEVEQKIGKIEGVSKSKIHLVFDPPWSRDRLSMETKLELGLL